MSRTFYIAQDEFISMMKQQRHSVTN